MSIYSTAVEKCFFSESPSWRLDRARAEIRYEHKKMNFVPSEDPGVLRLKTLLKAKAAFKSEPQMLHEFVPEIILPLTIYLADGEERDHIEAALMTDATWEDIQQQLGAAVPIRSYQFYASCFFDVKERIAKGKAGHLWLDRNVMAPCSRYEGDRRIYTAFIYKIAAYRRGLDFLGRLTSLGTLMDDREAMGYVAELCSEFQLKSVLRSLPLCDRLTKEQRYPNIADFTQKMLGQRLGLDSNSSVADSDGTAKAIGTAVSNRVKMLTTKKQQQLPSAEEYLPVQALIASDETATT